MTEASDGEGRDGVAMRTLVVGGLPLLVAAIGDRGRGPQLRQVLRDAGLSVLPAFLGQDLPRGAKVGFVLDGDELRLVDEREDVLLRAPHAGLDEGWLDAARRLKGTMMVAVHDAPGETLDPELPPRDLAETLDTCAQAGSVIGAIVGVVEERPNLPLLF